MPQQRIHDSTATKLAKIKKSVNEHREAEGCKKLTMPDIIDDIVDFFDDERNKHHKRVVK